MSQLHTIHSARAASQAGIQQNISFLARTLPPVNLANFGVVWWFAERDPIILALAGIFIVHVLVILRAKAPTLARVAGMLAVNIAIFFAAAMVAGSESPGWLLFIPPLVPATLLLWRYRYTITIVINASCLLANVLTHQRWVVIVPVAVALAVVSVILLRLTTHLHYQAAELERERARSDDLLDAVLPPSISKRIKGGETHIAERHDEASVLFADIAGFTTLSEQLSPEAVVEFLNELFTSFDQLVERHGVEKIKTIGDAYMVASGLDGADHDVRAVAELALDLLDAVKRFSPAGEHELTMRIGLHTGPVVAGIVGTKRFVYDVWGDTVNTASRMESHGVPNAVQVTAAVREALGDDYEFEGRGTIPVKGKGDMAVWLLKGRLSNG